ncbi:MAG: hypothetical protein ACREPR_09995, partial [Brasilonema sp.]
VLRTNFAQDHHGNPIQIIHEFREIPLMIIDLSDYQQEEREAQLQKAAMAESLRSFNPTFRTPKCHKRKLLREKRKARIKTHI